MRKVFIVICVIVTIISVTVSCQKHDDGPINIDDLLERLQEVDSDISLYSSTNSYQMTKERNFITIIFRPNIMEISLR